MLVICSVEHRDYTVPPEMLQARKAQALLDGQPESNEAEEARLALEAKYEEESLAKTCAELGVEISEVRLASQYHDAFTY